MNFKPLPSGLILLIIANFSFALDWNIYVRDRRTVSIPKPRIIGGDEVTPHSYPFQVGLLINDNAFCGGSLISPNYVLTAAHCGDVIQSVDVILGAHNVTANESSQVIIKGDKVIVHDNFNYVDYQNDIALVKLSEPAPINNVIKTVTLPSRADVNKTYFGETSTALGWGLTHDLPYNPTIHDISDVLRAVNVSILDVPSCGDYYNDDDTNTTYVTERNVCTTGYRNKGTCNGDSGGPLLLDGKQIGLVSIGTDLCEMCSPSIYTKVAVFLDWIEEKSDVVLL